MLRSVARFPEAEIEAVETLAAMLALYDSYHCSRLKTNTGRLSEAMFAAVLSQMRRYLDSHTP